MTFDVAIWRAEREEESRLKIERREAIRPLRKMLEPSMFGIRLPLVTTRQVLIMYGSDSRSIAWEDCSDRALVGDLQVELLNSAQNWLDRAWDGVVIP